MIDRRTLLTGLGAIIAAPAIVRASSLMPVKAWRDPIRSYAFILDRPDNRLFMYEPGTLTPLETYADPGLTVPNGWPTVTGKPVFLPMGAGFDAKAMDDFGNVTWRAVKAKFPASAAEA